MKTYQMASVCALLLMISGALYGQGRKVLREKGVAVVTVKELFLEEGYNEPVIESVEKFDTEGRTVELKEQNRFGEIRRWERYIYDEEGRLVEEIFLDERGRVDEREVNIYEDGLRVEKHYFDHRDRLVKKKVYEYEYHPAD